MTSPYLCNLIIPGAAKSGTTSLHSILSAHPHVSGAEPKEPRFFCMDENFEKGPDYHNGLFEKKPDARFFVESSQSYFVNPKAMDRIKENLDSPKIILLLRHPVERALSQFKWTSRRGQETASLGDAVRDRGWNTEYVFNPAANRKLVVGGLLAFSNYTKWVPMWLEAFGAENTLVLRTDDLHSNEEAVIAKCLDFIGLEWVDGITGRERQNTTAKAKTIAIPDQYKSLARLVPNAIKDSDFYGKVKRKMLSSHQNRHIDSISEEELELLRSSLEVDIEFYNKLKSV